jgi:hypothetical protein
MVVLLSFLAMADHLYKGYRIRLYPNFKKVSGIPRRCP